MKVLFSVLVGLGIAAGIFASVRFKAHYDQLQGEVYAIALIDPAMDAFLANVERTWEKKVTEKNGPEADIVRSVGKTPSVSSFLGVVDYQMPPYRWWAPWTNRESAKLGMFRALRPPSLDKRWHVTEDRSLAFLRCRENVVLVYRDEGDGIRMTMYAKELPELPTIRP